MLIKKNKYTVKSNVNEQSKVYNYEMKLKNVNKTCKSKIQEYNVDKKMYINNEN